MMNTILKFSLVSIGLAYSIHGYSASFDCSKASSPFEKTICSNPNLSSLDEQLANVYKTAREGTTNPDQLKAEQIAWIKATRNCGTDAGCIQQAYKTRIAALSPQAKVAQTTLPPAPAAVQPPVAQKTNAPIQLLSTQNKLATIGSCYAVLSLIPQIGNGPVGSMENYVKLVNQASAAKPSFELSKNLPPAGIPINSWNEGYAYTNNNFGKATDSDKLKAYNICVSAL